MGIAVNVSESSGLELPSPSRSSPAGLSSAPGSARPALPAGLLGAAAGPAPRPSLLQLAEGRVFPGVISQWPQEEQAQTRAGLNQRKFFFFFSFAVLRADH